MHKINTGAGVCVWQWQMAMRFSAIRGRATDVMCKLITLKVIWSHCYWVLHAFYTLRKSFLFLLLIVCLGLFYVAYICWTVHGVIGPVW